MLENSIFPQRFVNSVVQLGSLILNSSIPISTLLEAKTHFFLNLWNSETAHVIKLEFSFKFQPCFLLATYGKILIALWFDFLILK